MSASVARMIAVRCNCSVIRKEYFIVSDGNNKCFGVKLYAYSCEPALALQLTKCPTLSLMIIRMNALYLKFYM